MKLILELQDIKVYDDDGLIYIEINGKRYQDWELNDMQELYEEMEKLADRFWGIEK